MQQFGKSLAAIAIATAGALAQGPSADIQQQYRGVKNNLVRMAEKMPEEHYGFQPSPDIRTFGALMAHVADAQARNCSAVTGEAKSVDAASKTSKPDIVAALKASFEICDAAYESLNETTAAQMITTRRGQQSKIGVLAGNTSHSNEEYGYGAIYLRLKGVVPPSSDGQMQGGKQGRKK